VRLSLRHRLLLPLVALLLADAGATGWGAWLAAEREEQRITEQLNAVARTLTESRTFPLTARVLEQMKGLSGAEFVLTKRGGEQIATFPERVELGSSDILRREGEEYRLLRVQLPENHPNAGDALAVCYPESLRRAAVRDAVRPPLGIGIAFFIVGLVLFAFGSRIVSRVRGLELQTRAIAAGKFAAAVPSGPNDELRDLAESIAAMARQLAAFEEQSKQTERLRVLGQFSGGLAHQLRNAAAGAKLAVQLHLKQHRAESRESLDVALRQLARIEMNLSQFLTLGKPTTAKKVELDLMDVVTGAVSLYLPQAKHLGIALKWTRGDPVPLAGDAVSLGHLFVNLIGNAIDAAGPGGSVEVICEGRAVEVIDSGVGPPPEIAARLFETFVTGKEQGIGLGLTVAKQAADDHGGTIRWFRREECTVFRVEF
jgi:signal transduction histidine kinase